jgi:predicted Zn-dependent protease
MVWGSSLNQGVVVKNRFAHPDLALSLQLPKGWKVNNNPQFLEAFDPKNGAMVQIGVVARNKDESAADALKRLTRHSELEPQSTDYGATATTHAKSRDGESQPARISAILLENDSLLMLVGTADKKHFTETDALLLEINRSFRRLDAAQVAAIKAPRLRIVPRGTQTFGSLARDSALEYDAVNLLRLLNRSFPSGKIGELKTLKTVTLDD